MTSTTSMDGGEGEQQRRAVPSDIRGDARVGVIGGGILGLATAHTLLQRYPGLRVTVLEKEQAVAQHQTGRNSGVVHAGIYYKPGSLKAQLCVAGTAKLRSFCDHHDIRYEECGKLIVACSMEERPRLEALFRNGQANGVRSLRMVGPGELQEIEPFVTGVAGIHSPATAIVDFAAIARALADDIASANGQILTETEVVGVTQAPQEVVVRTPGEHFTFDLVISCAGLHADHVARMSGDRVDPMIVPFRGQYLKLRPEFDHLVRGLIYPVPDPRYPFLGVHLTRTVHGEVLVGPNAVLAFAREGYRATHVNARELFEVLRWSGFRALAREHWRTGLQEWVRSLSPRLFVREAQRFVPDLTRHHVVAGPSGIRAQALASDGTLVDDFRITRNARVVNVRNAPSPAATSSFAIAERIVATAVGT